MCKPKNFAHENFWTKLDGADKSGDGRIVVKNEKDLPRLIKQHPKIMSLPADDETKKSLAELSPKDHKYSYIMMDSGASLHAADLDAHFPGHVLEETDASRRQDYALTANGDKLFNKGSFQVKGSCNGVKMSLGFTNMKVDIPVASVRAFVKAGNEVQFFPGGGLVKNKSTGAEVPFEEMGGVYFLKLRVKSPNGDPKPSSLFARPGP